MKPILALQLLALAVANLLVGCSRNKPYEKPLTPVSVRAVEKYSGGGGVRYSANIEPYALVNLAFKVGGYIREIRQVQGVDGRLRNIQEGDWVAAGTVLARVRDTDYAAKVNQAKSQLAEALAASEQAKLDFDRATKLLETQSLTKPDFDAAKARFEVLQAQVQGAQAMLAEAEIAREDCALKAPMDGVLLKRFIEVGTLVGPGTVGFVLADTTSVKVVFGVPDVMLPHLKLGSFLAITTEAIRGREFRGRITRISPSADPKSRVFEVEITIPNPRNQLKAGMIGALEVAEPKLPEGVEVVPLTAIVRPKGNAEGYAVFIVEEQGSKQVARVRNVKLGEAFGNMIAVSEGVKVGERVIVTGATLVVDGEQVRVSP